MGHNMNVGGERVVVVVGVVVVGVVVGVVVVVRLAQFVLVLRWFVAQLQFGCWFG